MSLPELAQIEDDHVSILDRTLSLSLNASWMPIGERSIRSAITSMLSESNGEPPVLALDIEFDVDGSILYANPVAWEAWEQLSVRPGDLYVQTGRGRVRAPTVTIARHYNKVPHKAPRLSNAAIHQRDDGICQYTGEKLHRSDLSVDHVVPLDRGGRNEFSNMVTAKKKLNHEKGNRLNHEIGLKLLRAPKAPPSVPISVSIRVARHPSWVPFLIKS